MKLYGVILICLYALTAIGCRPQGEYEIKGSVSERCNAQSIFLYTKCCDSVISIDSIPVKNGKFTFRGKESLDGLAFIHTADERFYGSFILESGTIRIRMDSDFRAEGAPLNDLYNQYTDSCRYYGSELDKYQRDDSFLVIKKGTPVYDVAKEYGRFLLNFKKEHLNTPLGRILLIKTASHSANTLHETIYLKSIGSEETDPLYFLYALADEKLKADPVISTCYERKRKEDEGRRLKNEQKNKIKGQPFVDFTFTSVDGSKKQLADYVGKSDILVVDFWASWCAPCRGFIPTLKTIYKKYHPQGVDFISVSLDENSKTWHNALKKEDMEWPQLLYPERIPSSLSTAYCFDAIPAVLLINREGKVIEVIDAALLEHKLISLLEN